MDIFSTDWCSMGTVPSLEKKVEKMKTTDWCSTEVVVPSDGENLVVFVVYFFVACGGPILC